MSRRSISIAFAPFIAMTIGSGCESDAAQPAVGGSTSTAGSDSDGAESATGSESGSGTTGATGETGEVDEAPGLALLGWGTHSLSAVEFSIVGSPDDGLARPSDLAFNPEVPGQLWVTNMDDDSIVIYENTGTAEQTSSRRWNAGSGSHFLARPAALAFGAPGTMATAQQTADPTQPSTPWDFMGPTLWTSDASIFEGGDPSHLDMLHNSPNSSGIAWEKDNVYWVYDGHHGSLTRYDFAADHGLAGTDHTDGIIYRYVDGQLGYEPEVASHILLDSQRAVLVAADTANARIVTMDPSPGVPGANIAPNYDGGHQQMVDGAELAVLVDGSTITPAMSRPSGLELHEGVLYVTDYESSIIFGFSPEGELIDWLDTELPPESLMGIAFDTDGSLYGVDAHGQQVFRIVALEAPPAE